MNGCKVVAPPEGSAREGVARHLYSIAVWYLRLDCARQPSATPRMLSAKCFPRGISSEFKPKLKNGRQRSSGRGAATYGCFRETDTVPNGHGHGHGRGRDSAPRSTNLWIALGEMTASLECPWTNP